MLFRSRYYSLADRLPLLYTAVALDPDTKLKYFEIEWKDHPDWILLAKTKSKELWTSEYRSSQYVDTTQVEVFPSTASPAASEVNSFQETALSRWNQRKRVRLSMEDIDQFDRFQGAEEEEEVSDILAYWAARFTNLRWSQLAHMALEIHSIAAMSPEVERAFSRYVIFYYI